MKKYTQEEFDNFEVVGGIKNCPSGDYSLINIFDEMCRFGRECSFEKNHLPKNHKRPYFSVNRIGSKDRAAYFYDFEDGFYVRAGCFFGTKSEFLTKLSADKDDKKSKEYLAALACAEVCLGADHTQ